VSIVSTKIPFKGTGKEYIGDDITEISSAVKVYSNFPHITVSASLCNHDPLAPSVSSYAMLSSTEIEDCEETPGS
jgi:hypothetical protein